MNREPRQAPRASQETGYNRGSSSTSVVSSPKTLTLCYICVNRCHRESTTNACLHTFCFKCILKWSKTHRKCPVCHQTYNTVINTITDSESITGRFIQRVYQPPAEQLLNMYPEIMEAVADGNSDKTILLWRRFIYDNHLFALPIPDRYGKLGHSTAAFYRRNPAEVKRLLPFIERDIESLFPACEIAIVIAREEVRTLLLMCDILSAHFKRVTAAFLGNRTIQFVHELNNFARSPYDLYEYDKKVKYLRNCAQFSYDYSVDISSLPNAESADEDEQQQQQQRQRRASSEGAQRRRHRSVSPLRSRQSEATPMIEEAQSVPQAEVEAPEEPEEPQELLETDETSEPEEPERREEPEESDGIYESIMEEPDYSNDIPEPQQVTEAEIVDLAPEINDLSSSSDDCEFIREERPPFVEAPELSVINSESGNDAVYIKHSTRQFNEIRWRSTYSSSNNVCIMQRRTQRNSIVNPGQMPRYTNEVPRPPPVLRDYCPGDVINVFASDSSSGSDSDSSWARARRTNNKQTLKRFLEKRARANKRKLARTNSNKESKRAKNQINIQHNSDDSD